LNTTPRNGYRDTILGIAGAAALVAAANGLLMWRDVSAQEVRIEAVEYHTKELPQDLARMKECMKNIEKDIAEIKQGQKDMIDSMNKLHTRSLGGG
jgi:hypothetical protein